MPFTVENKEFSVIKFAIVDTINLEEVTKILGLISKIFEIKKPFSFFVTIDLKETPSPIVMGSILKYLVNWMKSNRSNIVKTLQGSAISFKSQIVSNFMAGVFKIQPTIKPNLITSNPVKAENFVTDIMKKYSQISC
jgi:hypothetical protein